MTTNLTSKDGRKQLAEELPSTRPHASHGANEDIEYPSARKTFMIMVAVLLAALLVALDRTIVATAIPVITNQLNSLDDVGWYASAYLLTMSSLQIIMGKIYTFYNIKYVFLSCIALFELGSLVCGTAPNSTALTVGRAIAGMGTAGLQSGAMLIVVNILPLRKRPAYLGIFVSIFGLASVAGPLLGGALTSNVSWRWCFYFNLPVGGLAIVVIFAILRLPERRKTEPLTWKESLLRLDLIGNLFLIPSIVCLLLALEWGGTTYVSQYKYVPVSELTITQLWSE
jgi:MFS family permease